jgi:hypothetical protein
MRREDDAIFPDRLPFSEDIDQLLSEEFWNYTSNVHNLGFVKALKS